MTSYKSLSKFCRFLFIHYVSDKVGELVAEVYPDGYDWLNSELKDIADVDAHVVYFNSVEEMDSAKFYFDADKQEYLIDAYDSSPNIVQLDDFEYEFDTSCFKGRVWITDDYGNGFIAVAKVKDR